MHLRGVARVEQGWIASAPPHEAYSEAVILEYDPDLITSQQLIEAHLRTHAATVAHPLRDKYRSAVYYFDATERLVLERELRTVASSLFAQPVVTEVLPFLAFKASLPEHQDYYRSDPDRPFCVRYIQPKLDCLHRELPALIK